MKIFNMINPDMRRICKIPQVCVLLLLFATVSGCGNKGDLYHPEDASVSHSHNNLISKNDDQTPLSL